MFFNNESICHTIILGTLLNILDKKSLIDNLDEFVVF